MRIDIVDISRRQSRLVQCSRDSLDPGKLVFGWGSKIDGIGIITVAFDLAKDSCPTSQRGFPFFQAQNGRPF
ncbi:hypothetical protein D3C75_906090 [compost metagenome]